MPANTKNKVWSTITDHPIHILCGVGVAAAIFTGWAFESLRVSPLKDQVAYLKNQQDDLQKQIVGFQRQIADLKQFNEQKVVQNGKKDRLKIAGNWNYEVFVHEPTDSLPGEQNKKCYGYKGTVTINANGDDYRLENGVRAFCKPVFTENKWEQFLIPKTLSFSYENSKDISSKLFFHFLVSKPGNQGFVSITKIDVSDDGSKQIMSGDIYYLLTDGRWLKVYISFERANPTLAKSS